ncbi:bifunctional folylpolyglutamate synthase/dihydrofolate synthase [Planctomicrobium sp. SH664]|uniref:bifunctional folylpolyglutamate synthase/dihydrofolate synthase n=1 Tax=Planctomicrobium sp. SH664 TaxID=3448125 RepID=UPI003F5BD36C
MSTSPLNLTPADESPLAERYRLALEFLYSRLNFERAPDTAKSLYDFKLNRMVRLLEALGNPQQQVKTVHVAGSKGKGSTSTMIARIMEQTGARVGLFTSPHVTHFEERFTVNGERPSQAAVLGLYDQVRVLVDRFDQQDPEDRLTFFELVTAMGWLHFLQQRVDLAVIEVGLGGRLDSTNICSPLVTLITSISRDHMRLLGDTVELIAREKGGIIKPGIPMVTAVMEAGPAAVIDEIAAEKGAPVDRLGVQFRIHAEPLTPPPHPVPPLFCFDYADDQVAFQRLELNMPGDHQARNAALAVRTAVRLRESGFVVKEAAIRAGLKAAHCPVRVEVVSSDPLMIVDAAHNPASMEALCATLREVAATKKIVIFASSRDKEIGALLRVLDQHFDEIWLTRYVNNARSAQLPELEKLATTHLTRPWRSFETPGEALAFARTHHAPGDLVCITGSFFLAAEVQEILEVDRSQHRAGV